MINRKTENVNIRLLYKVLSPLLLRTVFFCVSSAGCQSVTDNIVPSETCTGM